MCRTTDRVVWVQGLAVSIVLCSCARHLAVKCQDNLANAGAWEAVGGGGEGEGEEGSGRKGLFWNGQVPSFRGS